MGDHFVLLVDRLLTESTLEAAIESRNQFKFDEKPVDVTVDCSSNGVYLPSKMVECRICQDDDLDSNMEIPCFCRGSLKYAHRRCVQRWCNEKGDTICEICQQPFKPGYTAPPPMFQFGPIPLNFRGNWEISRRDLNNQRLIAMVSTDRNFLNHNYDDEYSVSSTRNLFCCRSVAIIFMVLLILRHTLPFIFGETDDYSLPLFLLLLLRVSGIVLPIYIIAKAVNAIRCARRQRESPTTMGSSSDEETEEMNLEHRAHIIHIP
ncbi:uncharacterized protein LOC124912270 [Impatiens glandulifera]|uniref:uncharacterized protein LOC124912270 n=1 Tax=Impatiens glandulifera TaxID=253017 RepID=UPI001FB09539|nr:uncharacterized protein LOC124912270 [Impatiens glandulifera]XP_047308816.1 uncharacterized protein LOC124912270 [Impatiens glandulifera]XP_047308817.1 uncharacterized protein LOC124912270 [Impatiens glandulifera]